MLKVKGIYDGTSVVLLDPLPLLPNSPVEVLVTDQAIDPEQIYWQRLIELGLIKKVHIQPIEEQSFTPIRAKGVPISQTIIEERR